MSSASDDLETSADGRPPAERNEVCDRAFSVFIELPARRLLSIERKFSYIDMTKSSNVEWSERRRATSLSSSLFLIAFVKEAAGWSDFRRRVMTRTKRKTKAIHLNRRHERSQVVRSASALIWG
jgi:hypothetical protein